MRVGVIVEQFDNTHHCHVRTIPPKVVACRSLDDLKARLESEYGYMVSYHYRDIGVTSAARVGWVFNKDLPYSVLETWISLVDPNTFKYLVM